MKTAFSLGIALGTLFLTETSIAYERFECRDSLSGPNVSTNLRLSSNSQSFKIFSSDFPNGETLFNAIKSGVESWGQIKGTAYFSTASAGNSFPRPGNSVNDIYFTNKNPNQRQLPPTTLARAYLDWYIPGCDGFPLVNGEKIYYETDIGFNFFDFNWTAAPEDGAGSGPKNIKHTTIHEMGHTVGLKHDGNLTVASMNSGYPYGGSLGQQHVAKPLADEREAMMDIYPGGTPGINATTSRFVKDSDGSVQLAALMINDSTPVVPLSLSAGQGYFMPYTIMNLGTTTKDIRVDFYMTDDGYIDAGDTYLNAYSIYTMPAGTEVEKMKWITIPNGTSGTRSFGYIVSVLGGGDTTSNDDSTKLHFSYNVN